LFDSSELNFRIRNARRVTCYSNNKIKSQRIENVIEEKKGEGKGKGEAEKQKQKKRKRKKKRKKTSNSV
jgi:transcription initiation factor TFIIIB Brf1 subunit/transcription initiation factor TFIIB